MSETPAFDRRLELFRGAADAFFAGGAWLAGAAGVPGPVLAAAAGLTCLVIDQARARFEAVLDRPIGVADAVYSVPGPTEVIEWFRANPRYPELAAQFDAELGALDWEALQRAHRSLYEVLVFQDPTLLAAFRAELVARNYRAVVDRMPAVRAALDALVRSPAVRGVLATWFELLTGTGPEADDAAARAAFDAHWQAILAAAVGAGE